MLQTYLADISNNDLHGRAEFRLLDSICAKRFPDLSPVEVAVHLRAGDKNRGVNMACIRHALEPREVTVITGKLGMHYVSISYNMQKRNNKMHDTLTRAVPSFALWLNSPEFQYRARDLAQANSEGFQFPRRSARKHRKHEFTADRTRAHYIIKTRR